MPERSSAGSSSDRSASAGAAAVQLRWVASVSASSFHAADACVRGRMLTDPRLAERIPAPATRLQETLLRAQLPSGRVWEHLLAFAHQVDNNRELAALAVRKAVRWTPPRELQAAEIADHITALEGVVREAFPTLLDELELRARPLREQWEARGPGLLRRIGALTDPQLLAERAEVILVQPALGGGGASHLANNSVRIEAVLTNNVPGLPEVVRLGWLLAQLQCDLPKYSEQLPPDRVSSLAQLALLPATLQAAQEVELAEFDRAQLLQALVAWHVDIPPRDGVAEVVELWWQTYQATRPPWGTALAALDRMLFTP